jgi:hypothetical protein
MRPLCAPAHLLRIKSGRPSRTRTCDLPLIRRMHSPPVLSVGGPRARVELASPLYRGGASPAITERIERSSVAYHATALPLSYTGLEPKGGFEQPSKRYEGCVFPTKLLRPLSDKSLERVTGFEPVSGPWQGPILAARRYPHGASGENRTLLACLEGRNSSNKSRSLEVQ